MLCANNGWHWPSGSGVEDFKFHQYIFSNSLLSPIEKECGPSFEQTWIPSSKDPLCQVWLKSAKCFCRRRFFNFFNVFLLFYHYLHLEKGAVNPLHPRILCAKFGWNWLSGSGGDFFNFVSVFLLFVVISPWKWAWPLIWMNLNPLYPG